MTTRRPAGPAGAAERSGDVAVDGGGARVWFGGLHFELSAEARAAGQLSLAPEDARFGRAGGAPSVASVQCQLALEPALPERVPGDRLELDVHDDAVGFRSAQVEAQLTRTGREGGQAPLDLPLDLPRYRLRGRSAAGPQAAQAVLRGAVAAAAQLQGGLYLHASGLELDGSAVLLVGPSGAGKSTATRLCEAGRCFAYDHVALFDTARGLYAFGLPGGTSPGAPEAAGCAFPLRAILRVRRGRQQPTVRWLEPAGALFVLRESTQSADSSLAAEQARIAAALGIAQCAPVGELHSVLGCSLSALLREALPRQTSRHALLPSQTIANSE